MLKATAKPSKPSRFMRGLWLTIALVAAGVGAWGWHEFSWRRPAPEPQTSAAPVPVDVATAEQADFPVYLTGIGVAHAWNTVLVRSRVEGQIDQVDFREGEMVKQGDLLLQLDPRAFQAALDEATATEAHDEALLANSKVDLDRYTTVGTVAMSQQQIDTQRALVAQQEAQIKHDKAVIDSARVQLGYATIRAPIAGRVGFRMMDVGNIVHPSDTAAVASITQVEPIAVIFTAPEEELPRINEALQSGPLSVRAYTSDRKTLLGTGKLSLVDNQVDAATGTIRLKAEFPNKDHKLWPSLTVSTRLLIETLHNVVVIPDLAVQRGPDGLFAYVVSKDGTVEMRKLKVSNIAEGRAVIADGIAAGERVVVSGVYRLQPGAHVEAHDSGAPQAKQSTQDETP